MSCGPRAEPGLIGGDHPRPRSRTRRLRLTLDARRTLLLAVLYVALLALGGGCAAQLVGSGEPIGLLDDQPPHAALGWTGVLGLPGVLGALAGLGLWGARLIVWRRYRPWPATARQDLPLLTVIVPCFNEGPAIVDTITSICRCDYPHDRLELIVVDDGSTDDSAAWAASALASLPFPARLMRLRHNQGKRQALARAMRAARGELWVTTDSDCQLDEDMLRRITAPLVRDPAVGLVAGRVRVHAPVNGLQTLLQVVFQLTFDWGRTIQSRLGQVLCVPGAAAAHRAAAVRPVLDAWAGPAGARGPVGEDRALTNRLLRRGWGSVYQSNAVVRTRVPATLAGVCQMHLRWARGDVRESLWYAGCLLGRHPRRRWRDGYFLLLAAEAAAPYVWLSAAAVLTLSEPRWLGVLPALAIIASVPMAGLYALAYGRREALWVPLHALLWPLLHGWVGLAALITPHRRGWLTRV